MRFKKITFKIIDMSIQPAFIRIKRRYNTEKVGIDKFLILTL